MTIRLPLTDQPRQLNLPDWLRFEWRIHEIANRRAAEMYAALPIAYWHAAAKEWGL
jgi:hypothetical protein